MEKKLFPILEFDESKNVVVDISKNLHSFCPLPHSCVISFFGEAVERYVQENNGKKCGALVMESFELPLFEVKIHGKVVALLHGLGSGPYMAGQLEKLSSMGCRQFIICGGCGVLQAGSMRGQIYIPHLAIRDEGTSYHYVKPTREISMSERVKKQLTEFLTKNEVKYSLVKTWTTDAMYRETKESIAFRKNEGCQIVEMECASCYAVAQYKGIEVGFLLYAGDDLSGKVWNSREWKQDYDTRYQLIELSMQAISSFDL